AVAYTGNVRKIAEEARQYAEVVVVDDRSEDRTLEALREIESSLPNVSVYAHDGAGVAAARRFLVKNSKGAYIWFVDIDDEPILSSVVSILPSLSERTVDAFIFDALKVFSDGSTLAIPDGSQNGETQNGPQAVDAILRGKLTGHLWNKIYRREIFEERAIPDLGTREDLAASISVLSGAKEVVAVKSILYRYEIRAGSLMNSRNFNYEDLFQLDDLVEDLVGGDENPYWSPESVDDFRYREVLFPIANELLRRQPLRSAINSREFKRIQAEVRRTRTFGRHSLPSHYRSLKLRLFTLSNGWIYGLIYKAYRRMKWKALDSGMVG
ncbi:MAG: glycosyltransferase family 2 protein, partial [Alphaproteobacteria bacterium]